MQHDWDFLRFTADTPDPRQDRNHRIGQAGLGKVDRVFRYQEDFLAERVGAANFDIGAGGAGHQGYEDIGQRHSLQHPVHGLFADHRINAKALARPFPGRVPAKVRDIDH